MISEETLYSIVDKAKKYDDLVKFNKEKYLSCSFCGKSQGEVEKMVAGPGVYICNECIDLCYEIIEEEKDETKSENYES